MKNGDRRRSKVILVLGGASSGKSHAALELAGRATPKVFVATGQALDREMTERIQHHQATRGKDWNTVEVPVNLAEWFRQQGRGYRTIVLDCVTLWLSNLNGKRILDAQVPDKVAELVRAIRKTQSRVVLVSNELGLGLVPTGRAVRRFRDRVGKVNQQIADASDEVYFIVSGQALRLK